MTSRSPATIAHRFDAWLHTPAPAERLALLRIAIGGFVTVYLMVNVGEFRRLAAGPAEQFEPFGLARLLEAPLPEYVAWSGFVAAVLLGLMFVGGLATRIVGPAFALVVLGWTSYHSSFGQLLHFEHLFTIHLLILAFAPVGDAFTLSRGTVCVRSRRASERYGWPIRLLALATAATYVLSGIAKLRHSGLDWFGTETLANHIGYSATRMQTVGGTTPPLAGPVLANQWLIPPMATCALAVELAAPLALVTGKLRNIWVAAALVFHLGTAATMWVFFGYRGLGIAMLPLFAVERVAAWRSVGARNLGDMK